VSFRTRSITALDGPLTLAKPSLKAGPVSTGSLLRIPKATSRGRDTPHVRGLGRARMTRADEACVATARNLLSLVTTLFLGCREQPPRRSIGARACLASPDRLSSEGWLLSFQSSFQVRMVVTSGWWGAGLGSLTRGFPRGWCGCRRGAGAGAPGAGGRGGAGRGWSRRRVWVGVPEGAGPDDAPGVGSGVGAVHLPAVVCGVVAAGAFAAEVPRGGRPVGPALFVVFVGPAGAARATDAEAGHVP
jgi:hypothetical protein